MKLVNSTVGRLLIAAVCIGAAQAAVWRLNHLTALAASQAAALDMPPLPLQLKEWSGTDVELDPRLLESSGALKVIANRSYVNAARRQGSRARLHLAADGALLVQCGTQDMGSGTYTALGQLTAEALGLPIAQVSVELGDTEVLLFFDVGDQRQCCPWIGCAEKDIGRTREDVRQL